MRFEYNKDYIYLYDGDLKIGEILFPIFKDNLRVINRTYVDPNYRSGGLASKLVGEAYKYLKENNSKVVITCPYVTNWFERYPEKQDIIDQKEQDDIFPFCDAGL